MRKLALLTTTCIALATQPAIAEPVTKEALGGLIKDYLIENPEVIVEAMAAYQEKEKEIQAEQTRKVIQDKADLIFNDDDTPFIGDEDAPVAVVEFFDYNCSACKYMFKSIDKLKNEGLKDLKVVFKEFPIFGEDSQKLAKMGLAIFAIAPDKYYDFHGKMMLHKGKVTIEKAYAYAAEVGLKREDIDKELVTPKYNKLLEDQRKLGEKLGVRGTPFMIVGKDAIPHAMSEEDLRKRIAEAREAVK